MKIGIVTFYNAYNCGAFLQAFALQKKLRQMGAEAYLINQNATIGRYGVKEFSGRGLGLVKYIIRYINEFFPKRLRRQRYDACILKHLNVINGCDGRVEVDCIITGSDQVWNPRLVGCYLDAYLLQTFSENYSKFSYGASFGVKNIPENLVSQYQKALSKFQMISVREESGASIVKDLIGRDATVVLDPTLLLQVNDYDEVSSARLVKGKYMCIYSVGDDPVLRKTAQSLARKKKMKFVYIQNGRMGLWGGRPSDWRVTSPDRFLSLIRYSECVVTNSFHGTIFSVLYQKPFVTLVSSTSKVLSRFETLLKRIGLEKQLLIYESKSIDIDDATLDWDIVPVKKRIISLQKDSLEFLSSILQTSRK